MLLKDKFLKDEVAAREWLEARRWPEGRFCPHCGSRKTRETIGEKQPYRCQTCYKYFSVRTGTVMQGSNLPILKWVQAMYLVSATGAKERNGDGLALHKELGLTWKTGWAMYQRILSAFYGRQ
ncbi:MAG: IS1595 family transposase [Gammaproteobacteria bacterium]|nr:IS1595 family transposase [Gammaproteobacteria bacterium]